MSDLIMQYQDGDPSKAVVFDKKRDNFVLVKARYGMVREYMMSTVQEVLDEIWNYWQNNLDYRINLRGIFVDDKNGCASAYVQIIVDEHAKIPKEMEEQPEWLKKELDGKEINNHGTSIVITAELLMENTYADNFFYNSPRFFSETKDQINWD